MNFVPTDLEIPLFLATRNRFKHQNAGTMENYIKKHKSLYTPPCTATTDVKTASQKKSEHIVGLDKRPKPPCKAQRILNSSRDLISNKSWYLPANRYGALKKPFDDITGKFGAYWPKLPKNKALPTNKPKPQHQFYEIPSFLSGVTNNCNKHKGVFQSNARTRKATSRCMVSSLNGCYHDPREPNSTTYYSRQHELGYHVEKKFESAAPNPHIFLRQTSVPAKPNEIHIKNASFSPAPGRYENRFVKVAPCSSRKVYAPNIQNKIEEQKRLKFRRLPYKKIQMSKYCSPEWNHVVGSGHTYLFKHIPKMQPHKVLKEAKKSEKSFQLFPESRYIHMINNPQRTPISVWEGHIRYPPVRVYFNCTAKRVVRKQLHNNKKIAFMSGQDRFKDADRPLILTNKQLKAIKNSLPKERQLRDHPIMAKDSAEIKSKLNFTPAHMLPNFQLRLRKCLFKFLPLPKAKILVKRSDISCETSEGITPGFYNKQFNPTTYY